MVSGTLYTYQGSFRANKVLIAAAYSGATVTVDPNFEYGKTNTSAEFLKKFPLGKVPAFESNGSYLNESDAIAQYVSNEALLGGNSSLDRAAVTEYISFSENEILPSACTWVYPTLGFKQYNKQDTDKAQKHISSCLSKLNNDLSTKTFLVGERVTLADITLCTNLVMLYVQVLDPKFRESYQNVNRWFVTCINQPNFKKVLGDVKICEKMAVFDNKLYQELHPKVAKAKKEEKPKQKKENKPEPAAASAPADVPQPKKKIDYFANVPASNFVMDDWKKKYSNEEVEVSWPWLVENFDKNALSIWFCEYQYKEENKVGFMAANAIGGYFQRIDGLRKHAFGSLGVSAEIIEGKKCFGISGIWMVRGQDNPFSLNPDWNVDAAQYDFRKLDFEKDQQLIKNNFRDFANEKGEEFSDGDIFK